MEQYQNVNGIILRSQDYKESDQLLTVYTKELGKITVQARGVKKTSSKLRSGILLFSQSELVLTVAKGFPLVTAATTVSAFPSLRKDLVKMSYASYAAELLNQVIADRQVDEDLFIMILQTYHMMEYVDVWLAVHFLETRLLAHMGYKLQMDTCLHCGKTLRGEQFAGVHGGLLCKDCARSVTSGSWLSQEGRTLLNITPKIPLHWFGYLYISREGKQSVENYLDMQLQQLLTRPLKTKDFLKQLNL